MTHTLKITHGELIELRKLGSVVDVARCSLAVHQARCGQVMTLTELGDVLGASKDEYRRRGMIFQIGAMSTGKKIGLATELIVNQTEDYNTFTDRDPETPIISKIIEEARIREEKRIKRVQNLDGITFKAEWNDIASSIHHLMELERESDPKELKKINYQITTLQTLARGESPKVQVYKKRNCTRLYSDITNLPSEHRKSLISKNGNRFVAIDITASQPRLFTRAIRNILDSVIDIFIYSLKIKNIDSSEVKSYIEANDSINDEFANWNSRIDDEMVKFDLLLVGDFYQNVADLVGSCRDDIKCQFMFYANDYSRKYKGFYELKTYMKETFPNLHEVVELIKDQDLYHRRFSIFSKKRASIFMAMSKIESEIILKDIVSSFTKNYPDANIFTIHDSIAVERINLPEIKELIEEAYNKRQIPLTIKIDNYEENLTIKEETRITQYIIESKNLRDFPSQEKLPPTTNQCSPLPSSVQTIRTKSSVVRKLNDGRFTCSVKNKNMNSRKGETLEMFTDRCIEAGAVFNNTSKS